MAIVAQSVEHRVVILDVAGSSPVGRPFRFWHTIGKLKILSDCVPDHRPTKILLRIHYKHIRR